MPEHQASPSGSLPVWLLAALGAVLIHAGCVALALAYLQPDDPDEALGAPAIEIGVEWTAPRLAPSDLPPGPEADVSAAAAPVMEQKAVVERTELPRAVPIETEDPDRRVAPDDTTKLKNDDPKVAAVPAAPSNESIVAEATAAPSS